MGSYNISCAMSGLSIDAGDEIVYIPLRKYRFEDEMTSHGHYIYPYARFVPLWLPLYGLYDDYGYIEKIEKTRNTEIILSECGRKGVKTMEQLMDDNFRTGYRFDNGMFVLRKIYDTIVDNDFTEWGTKSGPFHFDYDVVKGRLEKCRELLLKDLKKIGGSLIKDSVNKDRSSINVDYLMFQLDGVNHLYDSGVFFRDFDEFTGFYGKYIFDDKLEDELIRFGLFNIHMSGICKMYGPSPSSTQFGNRFAEAVFMETCLKLAKAKKAERVKERKEK